jgi:hypothetical protein
VPNDNYADAMLSRIIEEARTVLTMDSADRVAAIGRILQPYTGWALRWAVEDCRNRGMSWQAIARLLDRSYPAILRQFDAGGPVYAVASAQSPTSGNFDGETPLRRAATRVGQLMAGLGLHQPHSPIRAHLYEPVDTMTTAQTNAEDPAPLLEAVRGVVAMSDRLRATVEAGPMTRPEKETWAALGELRACYDRDRPEIEAAHQVQSTVAELNRPLVDMPGFTRDLRPNS